MPFVDDFALELDLSLLVFSFKRTAINMKRECQTINKIHRIKQVYSGKDKTFMNVLLLKHS
jgi:hypothetical protein